MANERRVVNKTKEEPVKVAGSENIVKEEPKKLSVDERLERIERYITAADPYIRSVTEIQGVKTQLAMINDELTKLAGVQSRSNSYIDGKFAYIDQTLNAIASIVKKMDDDFKNLVSDIEIVDEDAPQQNDLFEDEKTESK